MRCILLLLSIIFLCPCANAQLEIDSTGRFRIETQTTIRNETDPISLRIATGRNGVDTDQMGIDNFIPWGNGAKIGLHNYIHTRGYVLGVRNDVGSSNDGQMIGVFNGLLQSGTGEKTGIRNLISDSDDAAGSTKELYGVRTYIKHHNRPKAYGSRVDIQRSNPDTSHRSYGYYVDIQGGDGSGGAYGVYSRATGEGNFAGYFVGNVNINGSIVNMSDSRLKTDKKPITEALSIVRRLKPQTYKFKEDNRFGYDTELLHYGFMAQEVEEVLPAIVHDIDHPEVVEMVDAAEDTGPEDPLNTDYPAEIKEPVTRVVHPAVTLKGVRYTDLIAILTQAIQEQQEQINQLKKKQKKSKGVGDAQLLNQLEELEQLAYELQQQNQQLRDEVEALKKCTDCGGTSAQVPQSAALQLEVEDRVEAITIYPNPASAHVTIEYPTVSDYTVRVLTADGREFFNFDSRTEKTEVQTSGWPTGAYLFEISSGGEVVDQRTVVIKR